MSTCPNCTAQAEVYCLQCGQRQREGRLTLTELAVTGFRTAFDVERGLWPTLRDLSTRPGQACRDYIAGHRKRYLNPITYFLMVATLQLIDFTLSEDTLIDSVRQSLLQASELNEVELTEAAALAQAKEIVDGLANFGVYLFLPFLCLPYAVLVKLFNFKQRLHVAETLVFALFTVSHGMLFTSLTSPITLSIGFNFYGAFVLLAFGAISAWAGYQFFRSKWALITTPLAFYLCYGLNAFLSGVVISLL